MLIQRLFGRFVQTTDFFSCDFIASDGEAARTYRRLAAQDENGKYLAVPFIVANQNDELRVYGMSGFDANFTEVVSLIANPGQGKSLLATTVYNLMRGNDQNYFRTSRSNVSFTKGVWRLSDYHKKLEASKDYIDILDVEGLQKENSVYYLLIAVVVLSKAIVLLSRERINKEALDVVRIAFRILTQRGINLSKPIVFIQTKMNKDGNLVEGDGKDARILTKAEALDKLGQDLPIIKEFQVEFFRLREIPDLEVLEDSGLDPGTAETVVANATALYEKDVMDLMQRMKAIDDPVPSEKRMEYLVKVLDHLNDNNPDLVLEQNLEFFEKDAKNWLNTAVSREKEALVQLHLNKPLGGAKTLQDFFEPPSEDLKAKFDIYCGSESPFLGKESDMVHYKKRAAKVWKESVYATKIITAKDPKTKQVIGIMSYVLPSFQAKLETDESVLKDVYSTLRELVENGDGFDLFLRELPTSPRASYIQQIQTQDRFAHVSGIEKIIQGRWKQVIQDLHSRKTTLLSESKWIKKARTEGNLECPACGCNHLDGLTHKKCGNKFGVPTVLWYWVKGSTKHGMCNGCEKVTVLDRAYCFDCGAPLQCRIIPPDW